MWQFNPIAPSPPLLRYYWSSRCEHSTARGLHLLPVGGDNHSLRHCPCSKPRTSFRDVGTSQKPTHTELCWIEPFWWISLISWHHFPTSKGRGLLKHTIKRKHVNDLETHGWMDLKEKEPDYLVWKLLTLWSGASNHQKASWHGNTFRFAKGNHDSDVIISTVASQITSVPIVRLAVCSGADQRKY